jgi:hypothetical protein
VDGAGISEVWDGDIAGGWRLGTGVGVQKWGAWHWQVAGPVRLLVQVEHGGWAGMGGGKVGTSEAME